MNEAYVLFGILFIALALFIWGRLRYDVVAFFALIAAVLAGAVPYRETFSGLSNPAVITVACIMVLSQAILQSGIVYQAVKKLSPVTKYPTLHVGVLCVIVAVLSAFMNNVGALALMMPIAIQSALQSKRSPSTILMPLAFASILGGLMTVIGTPANILISSFRLEATGHAFSMFDFTPVGSSIVIVGVVFLVFLGWRWLPIRRKAKESEDLYQIDDYITEIRVPDSSPMVGKTFRELEKLVKGDFAVVGRIRGKGKRIFIASNETLQADDILIIEASHQDLEKLLHAAKLELVANETVSPETLRSEDIRLMEFVVQAGSRIENKSSRNLRLRSRYRINVLAVARQGAPFKQRLHQVKLKAGDVVLLQGDSEDLQESAVRLGLLPLVERGVQVGRQRKAWLPLSILIGAIAFAATGVLPIQIAFAVAVLLLVLTNVITARAVYESIDWRIVILLAAMIPIGMALQTTGGTDIIAHGFTLLTGHTSSIWIITLLLIISMTMSDLINNAATAVIMAPIAMSIANALHANIDTFLMAVAVGASCSFLTPIGHQNNTLVMGPGGYKFGDYWRLGLPLQILILVVGVPTILWIWPL